MSVEARTVPVGRARNARRRLVLPTAFITLLAVGTDLFVVSPLLPAIADQYGISPGTAGNSVTLFSVAYLIAAPCIGMVADRLGRRFVLIAGLALFAAANVLTGVAPTFGTLLAARVVAGVGAAAVTPSTQALVGQVAPAERRGTWMSVAVAGFLISLTTGAPTGAALASAFSWRVAFVALGGLALVLVAVNAWSWPSRAGAAAPAAGRAADQGHALAKIRAVSVTGLWAFAVYALYTYLGTALRTVAGLSTGQVAVALVLFGLGAVVGGLVGGRLADRFGARRTSTLSLALLAALQLLVDLAFHAPAGVLLAALGVFALVAYPCLPAFQARLVGAFPRHIGSVFAWNSCFMYLGTSLGAAAGGALLSSAGFGWIPVAGAASAAVGALVSWRFALPREPLLSAGGPGA